MQSEVWIWLESACTSWKIVTSWNHISHFDPFWSRHPLAPFSPTVVPLSTLPPPLTLSSSMTWKITSLSFGCQFCRRKVPLFKCQSLSAEHPFILEIPFWHILNLQPRMKNQTCQARKGTKKGPKHATFTRCSDKTQGFSDMSTDIHAHTWLTSIQISKSWRSRPPCAATCAWGHAPSAYLTTRPWVEKRNTMKGISQLSSIFMHNTFGSRDWEFRNLREEIKAGNLDKFGKAPENVSPQYSALPLKVSLDCTDTILMREDGICNLGRFQTDYASWMCLLRYRDLSYQKGQMLKQLWILWLMWCHVMPLTGDSRDSSQCRHIVDKFILLHTVEVRQCHRPQDVLDILSPEGWESWTDRTRNLPATFAGCHAVSTRVFTRSWWSVPPGLDSRIRQVWSNLNDFQSIHTDPLSPLY